LQLPSAWLRLNNSFAQAKPASRHDRSFWSIRPHIGKAVPVWSIERHDENGEKIKAAAQAINQGAWTASVLAPGRQGLP